MAGRKKQSTESAVREIRRRTRRKFAPEEKIRSGIDRVCGNRLDRRIPARRSPVLLEVGIPASGHIAAEFERLANVLLGRGCGNPALITLSAPCHIDPLLRDDEPHEETYGVG